MNRSHHSWRAATFCASVALAVVTAGSAMAAGPSPNSGSPGIGQRAPSADIEASADEATQRLDGIDVSHWQGTIRWGRVAADGIDFAIAKSTDGVWMVDEQYARNKARAERNGIFFTAYHYARPTSHRRDAIEEADFFVQHADLGPGNLVPALDLETTGGLGHRALQRWVLAWLGRVEERLGVKPMVYTSPAFWEYYLRNTRAIAKHGYEVVWIAHWGARKPRVPAQDWNGNGWTYWQWTSRGRVDGISGRVDRDWFIGDDLAALTIRSVRQAAAPR